MAGGVGSLHQEASYDKSKRGGFEPGKEEPGGLEEQRSSGEEGWKAMSWGGKSCPGGVRIFSKKI